MNFRLAALSAYRLELHRTSEDCDPDRQIYPTLLLARAHMQERYRVMLGQLKDTMKTSMKVPVEKMPIDPAPVIPAPAETAAQEGTGPSDSRQTDGPAADEWPEMPENLRRSK